MYKYKKDLERKKAATKNKAQRLGAKFMFYDGKKMKQPTTCSHCDYANLKQHIVRGKQVLDLDSNDDLLIWWVEYRVYRCLTCKRFTTPTLFMVGNKSKYGFNLQAYVESTYKGSTLEKVSDNFYVQYGVRIPPTTIFDWVSDDEKTRKRRRQKRRARLDACREAGAEEKVS